MGTAGNRSKLAPAAPAPPANPAPAAPPETAPQETAPQETTPAPTHPIGPGYAPAPSAAEASETAAPAPVSPEILVTPETPPWAAAGRTAMLLNSANPSDEAVYYMTSMTGPGVQPQGPGQSDSQTSSSSVPVRPGPGTTPPPQETQPQPDPQESAAPEPQPAPAPPAPAPSDAPYVEPSAQAGTHLVDYFSNSSELRARQHLTDKNQSRLVEELEGLITAFENETIHSADDVYAIREHYKDISAKLKQVQDGEDRRRLYDRCENRWLA